MLWDIDLIFGMWVYNDQVYVSFRCNDFWPSYGPWTFKFGQIFSCHHFFSLCLEILTWFLVYECIMMSYRSSLHFVTIQWFLAELYGPWTLKFSQIFSCHHFFFTMLWDIDLIFGMRVHNHKLQIKFEIHSGWIIFGQLTAVGLWNLAKYFSYHHFFFTMIWDIDLIFGIWVHSDEIPIKFEYRSDWMILG